MVFLGAAACVSLSMVYVRHDVLCLQSQDGPSDIASDLRANWKVLAGPAGFSGSRSSRSFSPTMRVPFPANFTKGHLFLLRGSALRVQSTCPTTRLSKAKTCVLLA
jgi:hypothetical protein